MLKYLCIYPTTQHSWRYDGKINGMLSIISYLGNCEIYIRSHGPTMTLQIYIYSESIKAYFLDTVVGVVLKHFSTDAFPYISPR